MNHFSRAWLILLVVLALVLAGCASAGAETAAPASGSGDQPAAPTSSGGTGASSGEQSGDQVMITKDSQGKTIEITVGQKLLVNLGEEYDWKVDVTPTFLLNQVSDAQLNKGEQGMYEAKMNGQATVQATGFPACAKAQPPCKDPTVQFNVNIKIAAAP